MDFLIEQDPYGPIGIFPGDQYTNGIVYSFSEIIIGGLYGKRVVVHRDKIGNDLYGRRLYIVIGQGLLIQPEIGIPVRSHLFCMQPTEIIPGRLI